MSCLSPLGAWNRPDPEPVWLREYLEETVGVLTGEQGFPPGAGHPVTVLTDRASDSNRALAAEYLEWELLASAGIWPERHEYGTGTNVYAILEPTQVLPDTEYIVLGAHYDSAEGSPGAVDNASGVAVVLAAAKLLADVTPRCRGVIFVFFDEEETGYAGSEAFNELLLAWLTSVHSVHTVDGVGWDSDGDGTIDLELGPDVVGELLEATPLVQTYMASRDAAGWSMELRPTITSNSDHESFRDDYSAIGISREYGIAVTEYGYYAYNEYNDLYVWEDPYPYGHTAQDSYDKVDFDYLGSVSALVNHTLLMLVRSELS